MAFSVDKGRVLALSDHDVLAPVENFYGKLVDYNSEVSYQDYVERVADISSRYEDLSFSVAPLFGYLSFLPSVFSESMKPNLAEIYPHGSAPFTEEQMDLIFEDLAEEEITGYAVIEYLVEVLREVSDEVKKHLN